MVRQKWGIKNPGHDAAKVGDQKPLLQGRPGEGGGEGFCERNLATRMVPNKFPEPRWNEFPTYVYLSARSLERTVWEDPKQGYTCGGVTRSTLQCAARLALFPPSANPPVSGPPFSVTGKPVARGRLLPRGGLQDCSADWVRLNLH